MQTYLLTAACFEHREILTTVNRLDEFTEALLGGVELGVLDTLHAWVALTNHYHLLAEVDLAVFRAWVGRLHNGKATQWNREDSTPSRTVWYRFSDRKIRSTGHFYATLNYLHFNPVRHKYVKEAEEWPWSSLHAYLETEGPETLNKWWRRYPPRDFGKGWDEWSLE